MLTEAQRTDLLNRFAHHAPTGGKADKHMHVRAHIGGVAEEICRLVPPGREQAIALTKLEEAMMWANAGIARNPEVVP